MLVILLDDVGFGASSAFGGPCRTPVAERLAGGGLKFNRFHTTALCAPTRQALLTGRNHHSVNMGSITETATSAPGQTSVLPNTKAPLATTLKLNGYSTAQFGKCHEVPVWQTSPMGPFDAWPTGGGGFETFYGFIGGENNQWDPALYSGTTPIEPPATAEEGYHLTEDLTDHAVSWMRQQKALMPDKPFFVYYAPGATHAPHHVPNEWIEPYEGQFDDGWDVLRERTFARQKELGVIPADTELTARHDEITAWDDMPDELKPVLARQMEVYAGFLEHTDHHVGRLVDALEDLEILDDTLIYYIIGDNGASAEGTLNGAFNEMANFNGMAAVETPEFMLSKMAEFGGPGSYNHYSVGWAWAMNSPLQWTKQVASHWGGTRNGTIVHWPNGIEEKGGLRSQFTHVTDLAPTILEAAGLPAARPWSTAILQAPMEGTSMLYAFNDAEAAERHDLQYFEMFGNRGIYHQGWSAVTKHKTPWMIVDPNMGPFDDDVWELYDGSTDFSQARNLAAEQPERLAYLQRLWLIEAVKYNVIPLDDRSGERFEPRPGRAAHADPRQLPALLPRHGTPVGEQRGQHQEQVLLGDRRRRDPRGRRPRACSSPRAAASADGPSTSRTARPSSPTTCWASTSSARRPTRRSHPAATRSGWSSPTTAGGWRREAMSPCSTTATRPGRGRVEMTQPMVFSADETTDIGYESGTTVSPDYTAATSHFTGKINWVQLDVGVDDNDHFIITRRAPPGRPGPSVGAPLAMSPAAPRGRCIDTPPPRRLACAR